MNFLQAFDESENGFWNIARALFDSYSIQTKDAIYRLTEIEFYWNSPTHKDRSAYERKHVDPKAGEWFFHYSGVDIALRDEGTGGYGGILIRSLYDINTKKCITGPQICAMKLFSGHNAFMGPIATCIIPYASPPAEIQNGERIGLGENAKEGGADKFKYRFWHEVPKGK